MKTEIIISAETNTKEYLELIGHLDKIKFPYKSVPLPAPMSGEEAAQLFKNNFDCYIDPPDLSIMGMTEKKFVEVIQSILSPYTPQHPSGTLWVSKENLIELYNQGYGMGHHDTVESQYTDIHRSDIKTYHEDVVDELITDMGILPAPPKKREGEKSS